MSAIKSCKSTFGKITKYSQTLDLPSSVSAPAAISFRPVSETSADQGKSRVVQVSLRVAAQAIFFLAKNNDGFVERDAKIAAKEYDIAEAGRISLPVVGVESTDSIYVRSTGAGVADGLSHTLIEGDTL